MKKVLAAIFWVLAATWLQVAWFGHIRPLGVIPNVMLVVVILYGLWSDATPALAVAVGGGLLLDLASGSDFGLRMGFYVVTVLAVIAARQFGVHAEALLTGVVAAAIGTIIFDAVVLATAHIALNSVVFGRVGRELATNGLLLALAYVGRAVAHRRGRNLPVLDRGLHA